MGSDQERVDGLSQRLKPMPIQVPVVHEVVGAPGEHFHCCAIPDLFEDVIPVGEVMPEFDVVVTRHENLVVPTLHEYLGSASTRGIEVTGRDALAVEGRPLA